MSVTETSSDSITDTEIATAISRKSWPASSSIRRTGINTMTVVNAETRTAGHTCIAPSNAASRLVAPSWRSRKIFSRTTIAASTTMPTANAMPARLMTLSERPSAAMATNEPITETGIESATTNIGRQVRRNSNKITTARTPP